jgi:hypothetical protein
MARGLGIPIFGRRREAQMGRGEAATELAIVAGGPFGIRSQPQAIVTR